MLRMRTTRLGSSTALPHMLSAALMQSSSVGSTIGIRLRRTPGGAGGEAVDVGLLPVDAGGDRRRDEVGEPDAQHVAAGRLGDAEQHDVADVAATSESARPCTQNRPVTLGSMRRAADVLAALLDDQHVDRRERQRRHQVAGVVGQLDARRRCRPRRPSALARRRPGRRRTRATRRRRAAGRCRCSAAMPLSNRLRISTGPHEWICAAPGCLPNPTTAIFVQATLDRALEAGVRLDPVDRHDAIGAGGVAVEVQRHAVGGAGDLDRLHRRPDLGSRSPPRSCRASPASPADLRPSRRRGCPSPARRTARRRGRAAH